MQLDTFFKIIIVRIQLRMIYVYEIFQKINLFSILKKQSFRYLTQPGFPSNEIDPKMDI